MGEADREQRARARRRRLTLGIGLALIAAGVVATLSHVVERRIGTNGLPAQVYLPIAAAPDTICQAGERVPAGTAAVRFRTLANSHAPPRLALTLSSAGVAQSEGTAARWDGGEAVVVPLARTLREDLVAEVCIELRGDRSRQFELRGVPTTPGQGATLDGDGLEGRLHLEFLAGEAGSWWSFAPTLARRLGRGHAWAGPSVALLVVLLMLTPIALSAWQLTRDDG